MMGQTLACPIIYLSHSDSETSQSKHNACGDARLQLPSAASPIGIDQVILKNSEGNLLSQLHIYPAAARHECETRVVAPYFGTKDIAVGLDVRIPVQRLNKPRD